MSKIAAVVCFLLVVIISGCARHVQLLGVEHTPPLEPVPSPTLTVTPTPSPTPQPTPTPEEAAEEAPLPLLSETPPSRLGEFSGEMVIVNCDVNQGDATLIVAPNGRALLFDTGTAAGCRGVLDACDRLGVEAIDVIAFSHFDADHYGGIARVLEEPLSSTGRPLDLRRGIVGKAYEPPERESQGTFQSFIALRSRLPYATISPGQYIPLDETVSIQCLAADGSVLGGAPTSPDTTDDNSNSVVLLIAYNGFEYLVTGDATQTVEDRLAAARPVDVDAYHAGHHGAETSSGRALLDAFLPETVIFSMGAHRGYKHPRRSAVERIMATRSFRYAFQTNKNDRIDESASGSPQQMGVNFNDEWIADLDPEGYTGHVFIFVNNDTYTVGYDNPAEGRTRFIEVPIER